MNLILCLMFVVPSVAWALQVGETYQQVVAQKGQPKSRMVDGASAVLIYPDVSVELNNNVVVAVIPRVTRTQPLSTPSPALNTTLTHGELVAALKKESSEARARVQKIVNQPVQSLDRSPGMQVAMYPDWFHPGATTPNFNDVDIRKTQQFDYDRFPYVALNSRPGTVYPGSQLEFNPMTKLFYADHSLPKKKLSETEMLEINRLYRIIGRSERQLNQLTAN